MRHAFPQLGRWLALAVVGLPALALAHHGWSSYETTKPMTLTGTISQAGYEHPHGFVRLDTPGKTWVVVLAPPSRMENRGLPSSALKAGVTAQVEGYVKRGDDQELRAERISIDGKTVELR